MLKALVALLASWLLILAVLLSPPPSLAATMDEATRPSTQAFQDLVWRCNPGPQREMLFGLLGRVKEIMWGGAKGGGKSAVIGPKAMQHVSEHPEHARILILREDYPQLADLMDKMEPQCRAMGGVWNEAKKTWTFPEGAKLRFGHLSKGVKPYWGQEYTLIIVDEVTRCIATQKDYIMLRSSLRNGHGIKGQIIILTNPGGPGHIWVKKRFKDGALPNVIQRDKKGRERVFIPANLRDNPHLPEEYKDELLDLPEAEARAFVEGDWDAFDGEVFRLDQGVHIITWEGFNKRYGLEPGNRAMPAEWRRYRVYDHGYRRPGACYWIAVDTWDCAWVYRELYTVAHDKDGEPIPNEGAKFEPREVARKIARASDGEKITASWTGPDLFFEVRQDQAGGVKLCTHFEAEGIYFQAWTAGPGSRIAGKNALHQRLARVRDAEGKPTGLPMLCFIEEECPHAIRTIPTLVYDKHVVEDVDSAGEDHSYDAVKGFVVMNPMPTAPSKEAPPKWASNRPGGDSRVG